MTLLVATPDHFIVIGPRDNDNDEVAYDPRDCIRVTITRNEAFVMVLTGPGPGAERYYIHAKLLWGEGEKRNTVAAGNMYLSREETCHVDVSPGNYGYYVMCENMDGGTAIFTRLLPIIQAPREGTKPPLRKIINTIAAVGGRLEFHGFVIGRDRLFTIILETVQDSFDEEGNALDGINPRRRFYDRIFDAAVVGPDLGAEDDADPWIIYHE